MKRSTQIGLGAAGVVLVASAWSLLGGEGESYVYETVAACRADGQLPEGQCEQRFDEAKARHEREAKTFASTESCEAEYGPGRCETRTWSGASVVVPALVGIMVARRFAQGGGAAEPLLSPTRQTCPPGSQLEQCQPRRAGSGGVYVGGSSGSRSSETRAYSSTSGDTVVAKGGTTRASVTSRGGFGATGHASGSSSAS